MEKQAINVCKLLIIGKSGVGKSSFCNYIFGKDTMRVGEGKPVTNWEDHLESVDIEHGDLTVRIYDTVGIEADNFEKWEKNIESFIEENKPDKPNCMSISKRSKSFPSDWLQGIFLLINAASGRVEPVEKKLIASISERHKIPLQIILTNCDIADELKINGIKNELKGYSISEVCSVSKRYRTGSTEPFGKEEVMEKFLFNSYSYSGKYFTLNIICNILDYMDKLSSEIINEIKSSKVNVFNMEILDSIMEGLEEKFDYLEDEATKDLDDFSDYLDAFDNYSIENPVDELMDKLESTFDNIDENKIKVVRKLENTVNNLEEGNVLEKLGALFTVADFAIRLEKHLIDAIKELFSLASSAVYELKREIELEINGTSN